MRLIKSLFIDSAAVSAYKLCSYHYRQKKFFFKRLIKKYNLEESKMNNSNPFNFYSQLLNATSQNDLKGKATKINLDNL